MRRRLPRQQAHEPSLVPLADMLTNTVGIIIFILIFTVLTASGVLLAKHLPMERKTEKKAIIVVCAGNRLYLRSDELSKRFYDSLGEPEQTDTGIEKWLNKLRQHKIENRDFIVTSEVGGDKFERNASAVYTPRADGGLSPAAFAAAGSDFRRELANHPPAERFVFFLVRPDSIDAYFAARTLAAEQGYDTGWDPIAIEDNLKMVIMGKRGKTPIPQ